MKLFLFIFQVIVFNIYSQTESNALNLFIKNSSSATVAFEVVNMSNLQEIIKYNEKKILTPASLQKLITTSAAIEILEKDFVYQTEVNFKGKIIDGNFKGIIEIVSSGDPSIDKSFIKEIIKILQERNVVLFEGYIVVKEDVFDRQSPKTWLVEDVANYYGSPAFSFNYNKNTFELELRQSEEGDNPTIESISIEKNRLSFNNLLISDAPNTGDNAYFIGLPFSNKRQIVGSIPAGKELFTIKGADNFPSKTFKTELITAIKNENIKFLFNANVDTKQTVFSFKHLSENLEFLVKQTNHKSINLYAEAFLKSIGLKKYGFGSIENGIKGIETLYKTNDVKIYDGSGLSRKNLLSSEFLIKILQRNFKNESFTNSLSISGISGTMKYFNSSIIKGKIKAKSGSADGILNYAGYFTNEKGEEFAFVFIVNNYSGNRIKKRKEMVKVLEEFIQKSS